MGRLEQDYREALDDLRFSGAGKERIMKNLMEQQERGTVKEKRFRPLRMALIAAAVCLALVGTAFAAVRVFGRVAIVDEVHEPFRAGYSVMGDVGRFSMGQFSRTFQEDVATGTDFASMKDWQSVKNYVGLSLMDSELLMEDSEHLQVLVNGDPFGVSMMGLEDGWVRALKEGERPQVVRVFTGSVVDNWDVTVTVFAATEYAALEQGLPGERIEYGQDYNGLTAHSFTSKDYGMACGETASIVYDSLGFHATAFFTHDGLLYQVAALGVEDAEAECPTGEEVLLKALDSFTP